jgi:hypothetical protein
LKSNFNDSRDGSRSLKRAKRRKTNIILNSLIGLVLLLIIIISVSIFSGDSGEKEKSKEQKVEKMVSGDKKVNTGKESSSSSENTDGKDDSSSVKEQTTKTASKTVNVNEKSVSQKKSAADDKKDDRESSDSQDVTEGGGDNVKSTIIKPGWEPIGTSQTGPFSNGDIDWAEREKALAYAIGVDQSNMTNWYLGRAGEDQSIGTISAKDNPDKTYRVYLKWQDGKGWKPVKVEELIQNDKRQ